MNSENQSSYSFEAGLLIRKTLRNFLNRMKFEGAKIDFFEQKGFLDSVFTIRGNASDVEIIANHIKACSD